MNCEPRSQNHVPDFGMKYGPEMEVALKFKHKNEDLRTGVSALRGRESMVSRWKYWAGTAGAVLAFVAGVVSLTQSGRTSPVPGLHPGVISNNLLLITVTNAATNEFYEIYSRQTFGTNHQWSLSVTGALAQSNFWVPTLPSFSGFWRAQAGRDMDGDGVETYRDGDAGSTNVGELRVWIVSPVANGNIND